MNDSTLPGGRKRQQRPRAKAGVRRGFGLRYWNLLVRCATDLAQTNGAPLRRISPAEVSRHSSVHDAWVVLQGKVYNITPYLPYHPGGVDIFKPCLGGDASELFDRYHRWVNTQGLVGCLLLGELDAKAGEGGGGRERVRVGEFVVPPIGAKRGGPAAALLPTPMHSGPATDGFAVPAPRPPKAVVPLLPKADGGADSDSGDEEGLLLAP